MRIDPFTKEEKTLLVFAGIALVIGLFILSSSATFTASVLPAEMSDIFAGTYQDPSQDTASLPDAETIQTANMPDVELEGLEATPSPQPMQTAPEITLHYPDAGATLTSTRQHKRGYPLKLRFEVNPKKTVVMLELKKNGVAMMKRNFQNSSTGQYEVKLLIRSAGHYQWTIRPAATNTGDPKNTAISSRFFTIRSYAEPPSPTSPIGIIK